MILGGMGVALVLGGHGSLRGHKLRMLPLRGRHKLLGPFESGVREHASTAHAGED